MVEMLQKLHKHFELILFTAGHRPYAEAIVEMLQRVVIGSQDPQNFKGGYRNQKLFSYVLSRECCTQMPFRKSDDQYYYLKDLRMLQEGRKLSEMLIIDNRALSFANLHLTNGIPIKDYEGDKSDRELPSLTEYLMGFRFRQGHGERAASQPPKPSALGSGQIGHKTASNDVRNIIKKDFDLERYVVRQ